MAFSSKVLQQLRRLTVDDFILALKKDGWTPDPSDRGKVLAFTKHSRRRKRIMFSFQPGKPIGPRMLQALLSDLGWSERDMRRLKLLAIVGSPVPQLLLFSLE